MAKNEKIFQARVITAFDILADKEYYHYVEDDEREYYTENTVSFIRCFAGEGKITLLINFSKNGAENSILTRA